MTKSANAESGVMENTGRRSKIEERSHRLDERCNLDNRRWSTPLLVRLFAAAGLPRIEAFFFDSAWAGQSSGGSSAFGNDCVDVFQLTDFGVSPSGPGGNMARGGST